MHLGQAQHAQRQADLVVLVARVPQRAVMALEDLGRQLLGARLPDAAGDADHAQVELRPPVPGDRLQRGERAGDADTQRRARRARLLFAGRRGQVKRGPGTFQVTLHQGSQRPALEGCADMLVPVRPLSRQGDEQRAGDRQARVDGAVRDHLVQEREFLSRQRLDNRAQRQHRWLIRPPRPVPRRGRGGCPSSRPAVQRSPGRLGRRSPSPREPSPACRSVPAPGSAAPAADPSR